MKLPDTCEVYPAHGAGSLCGRAMAAKRTSTIGYEKKFNYALKISDRRKFIDSLTHGMPDAPDHFHRCTDINRQGPVKVIDLPSLKELGPPLSPPSQPITIFWYWMYAILKHLRTTCSRSVQH